MDYASYIGNRYIRSKKKETISSVTLIAIIGVAMGVGLLSAVFCIASGFQDEFVRKVLGVNAHVLVMKYGMDFHEYRDTMKEVKAIEGVKAIEPFVIQEMMISKGARTAGILLKGVDPTKVGEVLDLPDHLIRGTLDGMRIPGSGPPVSRRYRSFSSARQAPADEGSPSPEENGEGPVETGAMSPAQRGAQMDTDAVNDTDDGTLGDSEIHDDDDVADESDSDVLPGIVIGTTLSENIGADVGDVVQVTTPLIGLQMFGVSGDSDAPKFIKFKVIGVFHAGFHEYDTKLVFSDYFQAARFFDNGDSVTGLELVVDDPAKARMVAAKIDDKLGEGLFRIWDWEELNKPLFNALETQKLTFAVLLSIVVLLAALNIVATLIMMVFDKKKEIAILKSMGATYFGIMRIFLHAGMIVGGVGVAIGLSIGLSICLLLDRVGWPLDPSVYLIDHLPVAISWTNFVVSGVVAFVICMIATAIPSLLASMMRPVDGIREA